MRLYILRHGKADKESPTGRDEDRPLVDTGRDQARFIAAKFRSGTGIVAQRPSRAIASTAARAAETARLVAEALGVPVAYDDSLLPDQDLRRALTLVDSLVRESDGDPVLLVGHNPQLEDLARALAGKGAPQRLRTGELAALDADLRAGRPHATVAGTIRADEDD